MVDDSCRLRYKEKDTIHVTWPEDNDDIHEESPTSEPTKTGLAAKSYLLSHQENNRRDDRLLSCSTYAKVISPWLAIWYRHAPSAQHVLMIECGLNEKCMDHGRFAPSTITKQPSICSL